MPADRVIDHRRGEQQERVRGLPAHVEVVTGGQQQQPTPAVRNTPEDRTDDGEENQEMKRIELHGGPEMFWSLERLILAHTKYPQHAPPTRTNRNLQSEGGQRQEKG